MTSFFATLAVPEYLAAARVYLPNFKIRPEVCYALLGFCLGMCMSMGPVETFDTGVFVVTQAASATAWTANWFVEPKYTGQEDLPPGFRGEAPNLGAGGTKETSGPGQCQTIDPSALVCSTVRVSGFDMFPPEEPHQIFYRRSFDEIQGRAPFVSENGKFLAFWCEQEAAWRLSPIEVEGSAREGSCKALAQSSGGVQFKDALEWAQSSTPSERGATLSKGGEEAAANNALSYLFELQVGDDWVEAQDITCR